jgi:hypothetical protein
LLTKSSNLSLSQTLPLLHQNYSKTVIMFKPKAPHRPLPGPFSAPERSYLTQTPGVFLGTLGYVALLSPTDRKCLWTTSGCWVAFWAIYSNFQPRSALLEQRSSDRQCLPYYRSLESCGRTLLPVALSTSGCCASLLDFTTAFSSRV